MTHARISASHQKIMKPPARAVLLSVVGACSAAPLHVRIDQQWYDLSRWRAAHPSGAHWITGFAGRDATEVFHAFHSDSARKLVSRLPRAAEFPAPPSLPPSSALATDFRSLRAELVNDGWFERDWQREAANLAPCLALFVAGTAVARASPLLATVCLGLGSTAAGWLGHDFIHGRGRFCSALRGFGALFNGHSAHWWSAKHNLHHALTNVVGFDEDIMSDPFFFLWAPDPERDSRWRPVQHLYAPLVFSSLFALWRVNSLRTLHNLRLHASPEAALIALNYAWMAACLPLSVAIGHVLLAGFFTATIVTASHQSEELIVGEPPDDWVELQMRTTRDAVTSNPFSEWLWGGMQYQSRAQRHAHAHAVPR